MKIFKHLFTALLLHIATAVTAHDFEEGGIYYNITNATNKTVAVTYEGDVYYEYSNECTGSVSITEIAANSSNTNVEEPDNETLYFSKNNSLPGNKQGNCYVWESGKISFSSAKSGIRLTVFATNSKDSYEGYPIVALGELEFYDGNGDKINYTAADVSTNSLEESEGSLAGLCDGDYSTFYHSTWSSGTIPNDYVYLDVQFPQAVDAVNIKIVGRNTGRLTPTHIGITENGVCCAHPCGDNAGWNLSDGVLTISGTGAMYDYSGGAAPWNEYGINNITSVVVGEGITHIGDYALYGCSGLKSVEIPSSVTSIGNNAFNGCTSLKDLRIEDGKGTLSLGFNGSSKGLFSDCPLETLYLGRDLFYKFYANDGISPFYNKNTLTSVTIGNSVTSIRDHVFAGCTGLTSIVIPNSITSIAPSAFSDCTGLTSIIVATGNANYDSRDNCNAIIETATNTLVAGCKNTLIPNSVTSIGYSAFWGCSGLTSIVIPNSVTSIGESTFEGCYGLTSIIVTAGNANYDSRDNCNAIIETATNTLVAGCKNTLIPNSVTSFGKYAFSGCTGLTSIVIPNSVTSIGYSAFSDCTGLTGIEIPNSVTSIDEWAFCDCTGLTSIEIPNSVTSIEKSAFYGCTGLTSVVIPNSVTCIGDWAFYNCTGLTGIVIPNSVTSIGGFAFSGCTGLTSITIPNSVTSIGGSAFYGCTGLKTIYNFSKLTFSKGSSDYGYIVYYADKVYNVPNGSIEGDFIFGKPNNINTLLYYLGNATELTLPDDYKGENYAIGVDVFKGNTTITSVVIPNSVTSIENDAFSGCTSLTTVHISDLAAWCGIDFASANANPLCYAKNLYLNGEKLTELVIPDGVVEIKNYTFYNCNNLTSVEIPNSVTSIGEDAFYGCTGLKTIYNFSNLTFSEGSSDYGYIVYYADKVYNVPNGSIEGDFIFGKPNNVNTLLYYLGNATEVILPADYKGENYVISADVFKGNTTITGIEIPSSVTSIENAAFNGCTSLKELRIEDGKGTLSLGCNSYNSSGIGEGLFSDCPLETLYLGRNLSYDASYKYGNSPFYNKKTLKSVTIGNSVTSIGDYAFYNCEELTSVEIPNSVTSIGNFAFDYCEGLTSIEIPNSVTSIGGDAFSHCTGLTSIEIPNSVTSIRVAAFSGCTGLTSITVAAGNANYDSRDNCNAIIETATNTLLAGCKNTLIPNSVTSIGEGAFYGYSGLTSIEIPNSVTSIGGYAFGYCTGLTSIEIPNSVTRIGEWAFRECRGLTSITVAAGNANYDSRDNCNAIIETATNTLIVGCKNTIIPNSVTNIGDFAFEDCTGLTSVTIPNSVTSIGEWAFSYCYGLTSVVIPNSVTSIGWGAFFNCTGLTSIGIPNNVTSIEERAFEDCKALTSIEIPSCVTSIGSSAFNGCSGLTSIEIPNSVTSIGSSAFEGCTNIESLYISTSLESIGTKAFAGCEKIMEIKIGLEKPIRGAANIFADAVYDNAVLYVPTGTKSLYEEREPWNLFFDIAEMDFTGIDEVYDEVKGEPTVDASQGGKVEGVYYDLSGRAVENPSSGIYILNGKKVIIK